MSSGKKTVSSSTETPLDLAAFRDHKKAINDFPVGRAGREKMDAICQSGKPKAITVLYHLLSHKDASIRFYALKLVSTMDGAKKAKPEKLLSGLLPYLCDKSLSWAIEKMNEKDMIVICSILSDEDRQFFEAVVSDRVWGRWETILDRRGKMDEKFVHAACMAFFSILFTGYDDNYFSFLDSGRTPSEKKISNVVYKLNQYTCSFEEMTNVIVEFAGTARKNGILALEGIEFSEAPFFSYAINLLFEIKTPILLEQLLEYRVNRNVGMVRKRFDIIQAGTTLIRTLGHFNVKDTMTAIFQNFSEETLDAPRIPTDLNQWTSSPKDIFSTFIALAHEVSEQGFLSIESHINQFPHAPTVAKALEMVVDGIPIEILRDLMAKHSETLIRNYERKLKMATKAFVLIRKSFHHSLIKELMMQHYEQKKVSEE